MGKYIVEYLPSAERYLKKLKEKPLKRLYLEAIQAISANPYAGEAKTGDLAGFYGYDIKYKGISYELAYRIYEEEDGNVVVVIMCGTRENFYNELKRFIKTSKLI
ncbi:plasmid stabilization protein [Thermoactinomyces vulgaris]|uniref:mRNA interferase RelE/StbE n=1 Tax=Laceyella sediminis TaxID=573074 RepID=A0ABX5ELH4_9BACL|nr:type II toxin-antitoxin system RelE/ParE family toxin [Laceyella sediminis]KPC74479.1 plasmid stabilization protein [Thermoactinomyces vulgaris]PRZ11660.1 mRNA interferase RelE/StbE [Laceyella sediminis]